MPVEIGERVADMVRGTEAALVGIDVERPILLGAHHRLVGLRVPFAADEQNAFHLRVVDQVPQYHRLQYPPVLRVVEVADLPEQKRRVFAQAVPKPDLNASLQRRVMLHANLQKFAVTELHCAGFGRATMCTTCQPMSS